MCPGFRGNVRSRTQRGSPTGLTVRLLEGGDLHKLNPGVVLVGRAGRAAHRASSGAVRPVVHGIATCRCARVPVGSWRSALRRRVASRLVIVRARRRADRQLALGVERGPVAPLRRSPLRARAVHLHGLLRAVVGGHRRWACRGRSSRHRHEHQTEHRCQQADDDRGHSVHGSPSSCRRSRISLLVSSPSTTSPISSSLETASAIASSHASSKSISTGRIGPGERFATNPAPTNDAHACTDSGRYTPSCRPRRTETAAVRGTTSGVPNASAAARTSSCVADTMAPIGPSSPLMTPASDSASEVFADLTGQASFR